MSVIIKNSGVNYSLYYNVLDYFKTIMSNHPSIAKVTQGDIVDIDAREYPAYPFGNVLITQATFTEKTTDFNIQLTIADKIKNKNNESSGSSNAQTIPFYGVDDTVDIHANTLAILNDLTSYTQRSVDGLEINGEIVCNPFSDSFNNGLAGWSADFTLTVHNNRDICLFDLITTTTTTSGPTTTTTTTTAAPTTTTTSTTSTTTTSTTTTSTTSTTTAGPTTTTTTSAVQIWAFRDCGTSNLPTVYGILNSPTIVAGNIYTISGSNGLDKSCQEALFAGFSYSESGSVIGTFGSSDCSDCLNSWKIQECGNPTGPVYNVRFTNSTGVNAGDSVKLDGDKAGTCWTILAGGISIADGTYSYTNLYNAPNACTQCLSS